MDIGSNNESKDIERLIDENINLKAELYDLN